MVQQSSLDLPHKSDFVTHFTFIEALLHHEEAKKRPKEGQFHAFLLTKASKYGRWC